MAALGQTQDTTVKLSVQIAGEGNRRFPISIDVESSLLDLLQTGANEAELQLLPTPKRPLDTLHNVGAGNDVGPAILDLGQSVGELLNGKNATKHFAITPVLAIRLNSRWAIATAESMTPREILALFGLEHQQYTLYPPGSNTPLPLDDAIKLSRGDAFEAQLDGKYGAPDETA